MEGELEESSTSGGCGSYADKKQKERMAKRRADESSRAKTKTKRTGSHARLLQTFGGSHARVLTYFRELGNFTLHVDEEKDELLVAPRHVKRKLGPRHSVFYSRFGVHFRALGFHAIKDGEPKYAFVHRSYSQTPLDLETLEPPRDAVSEAAMFDVDVFWN